MQICENCYTSENVLVVLTNSLMADLLPGGLKDCIISKTLYTERDQWQLFVKMLQFPVSNFYSLTLFSQKLRLN